MIYRQILPSYPLNEFVDSIYYLKGDMGQSGKKILPDYKTDLIFLFDSNMTGYTDPEKVFSISTGIINGFRHVPLHFKYNGNAEMVGIRFLPYGFTQLFGIPPKELKNFPHVSDVLDQRQYREIMERLGYQPDPMSKLGIIARWLLDVLDRSHIQTSLAIKAVHRIASTKGIVPLNVVCNNSPSEYKQLQRFCHNSMDISPKSYARMVRFEHLHNSILTLGKPDWMDLVADFEFTDQSHLIREIKQFTGLTPKAFLAEIDSFI